MTKANQEAVERAFREGFQTGAFAGGGNQSVGAEDEAWKRSEALDRQSTAPDECYLCAGKCRGHSLGHPEQWEAEPGSAAYAATAPDEAGKVDEAVAAIALGVSEQVSSYLNDMLEDINDREWEAITVRLYEIAEAEAIAALSAQHPSSDAVGELVDAATDARTAIERLINTNALRDDDDTGAWTLLNKLDAALAKLNQGAGHD